MMCVVLLLSLARVCVSVSVVLLCVPWVRVYEGSKESNMVGLSVYSELCPLSVFLGLVVCPVCLSWDPRGRRAYLFSGRVKVRIRTFASARL